MPIHIWAALNGLISCLKRERERENMKFGGKYVGRRFRSCTGKDMIIIHCIHVGTSRRKGGSREWPVSDATGSAYPNITVKSLFPAQC